MRKIDQLFAEYAASHQNHTNKTIHWICVPLIFWSILGFISLIPAPHFFVRYFGAISVVSLLALAADASRRRDASRPRDHARRCL